MICGLRLTSQIIIAISIFAVCPAQAQTPAGDVRVPKVELPEQPTAVVANVDGDPILLRDVSEPVENKIKGLIAQSGQTPSEKELSYARMQLIRIELRKEIQGKMMYRAFLRKMTGNEPEDKRAEMEQSIMSNVRKMFYEKQLPQLLKQYDLETIAEADAELRKTGSSLEQQERRFVESVLGQEYMRGELEQDPEIPLPDMKYHYHNNIDKYKHKAKARWEQLTVQFSKFDSKQAADAAIRQMGTEAYFGGNMQAVAKRLSQEPLASETGGLHDWTNQGSLASDVLDKQIFELPLNKMSDVIEDDMGFHIIKVLEREPAGVIPFSAAQEDIRSELQKTAVQEQQRQLLDDLANRIPVWSLFPDDVPKAMPLRVATKTSAQSSIR